jgi:hypothetical protein
MMVAQHIADICKVKIEHFSQKSPKISSRSQQIIYKSVNLELI